MSDDLSEILSLDRQLCFPLYAASNLMTRLYRPLLAEVGLTYPQYLVMMVLWETSPVSMKALCSRLYLDSGTLTPVLKRMAAAGLVTRTRDPSDERRIILELTGAGAGLKAAAQTIPIKLVAQFDEADPGEAETFRLAVRQLAKQLSDRLKANEDLAGASPG